MEKKNVNFLNYEIFFDDLTNTTKEHKNVGKASFNFIN